MSGGHGVGVKMLHVFGDKLWGIEPSVTQQIPLSGPTRNVPTLKNDDDFPALGAEKQESSKEIEVDMQNLDIAETSNERIVPVMEDSAINQTSPDEVLTSIFLSSLKLNKKQILTQLPILVSTFYPNYIQKEMDEERSVNIKETSFKKVSTFFKRMNELGYLTIKEETKGVEKIVAINFDHSDIVSFIPKKKDNQNRGSENEPVQPQLLLTKMTELYVVTEFNKKLFNALGVPVGKSLDLMQIKNYVKDYVCRKKLLNSKTGTVELDESLREITASRNEGDLISYDQLLSIVIDSMDSTYEMRSQTTPQVKGGKRAVIQITTANRSGNKKVTLIENLDAFGINIAEFSKSIKVAVAASTTMTKAPGTNKDQFLVQGNHVKFIYDLLADTYKVPRNCITGLEFAKKEKKKK
jgi:translation initiation factor 2D